MRVPASDSAPLPARLQIPTPAEVAEALTHLDGAGLSPEAHAVLKDLAEQFLKASALIRKQGMTMTELRSRLRRG